MAAVLEFESDLSTQIELRIHGACLCPVNGKQDQYDLTLLYCPSGRVLELGWLADWVEALRFAQISHEDLTNELAEAVISLLGPTWIKIETTWAPIEGVECTVRIVAGE